jgi:hypothetical protein
MIGIPPSKEVREKVSLAVSEREKARAASKGMTVEELRKANESRKSFVDTLEPIEAPEGVDDEAVLRYLHAHEELFARQRDRIGVLSRKIRVLEQQHENDLEKIRILQETLKKMRSGKGRTESRDQ